MQALHFYKKLQVDYEKLQVDYEKLQVDYETSRPRCYLCFSCDGAPSAATHSRRPSRVRYEGRRPQRVWRRASGATREREGEPRGSPRERDCADGVTVAYARGASRSSFGLPIAENWLGL